MVSTARKIALAPLVDKGSDLKTEANLVHLRCIHHTMEILDDRQ